MKRNLENWLKGETIKIKELVRDKWEINKSYNKRESKTLSEIKFRVADRVEKAIIEFMFFPEKEDWRKSKDIISDEISDNEQLSDFLSEQENEENFIDKVLPFRNHINFIIYDSRGNFRGRWDHPSHFGQEIIISRASGETSNGFISGPLPRGEWKLIIEKHSIITDKIDINLKIKTLGEFSLHQSYSGELHAHSIHSDGNSSLEELQRFAAEKSLDYIAITDHNNISGWHGKNLHHPVTIIPGLEFSTFDGHALSLNIDSFINWHDLYTNKKSLNEIIEMVHYQGGLFGISHPLELGDPLCVGCRWNFTEFSWENVDFLEVWVRNWSKNEYKNDGSYNLWKEKLSEGYQITAIASNDLHDKKELNKRRRPLTFVQARSNCKEELINSIWEGRVYLSSGPIIDLSLSPKGSREKKYYIGDLVSCSDNSWIINVNIEEIFQAGILKIIGDNGELKKVNFDHQEEISIPLLTDRESYIYIEITNEEGEILLISNPIYFTNK